ncbi:MAG: hypothetical protein RLZZ31_1135 [Actinomycetota bacterium]
MGSRSAQVRARALFIAVAVMASTFAFAVTAVTPKVASAAVANAPTITAVTPGDGSLQVAFTAPSGATGITNYEYSIDGGLTWVARSPNSTASPITITGLSNCTTYPLSIRAVNSDGAGLPAESWNGVPSQYTYALNNGKMRFGNGSEASILPSGNLKAPTYSASNSWWPMTYGSTALNYALGVGGVGTNEWNTNGTIQEFSNVTLSRQTIDCSAFVVTGTSGSVATGYGTLATTGRYTFSSGEKVEITRRYTQTANSQYTVFSESIKNVGTSTISNARLWVGTQDDYIGSSDTNTKRRGNINSSGVFSKITSASQQAKVLEISNGTDTVYFYTTSNLGNVTGLQRYGNFVTQVVNLNPASAAIEVTNDGSYGMFLRFQDLAPDAVESFSWYYVATPSASAQSVLAGVATAALPQAPSVSSVTSGNSSATVNFTAGDAGGAPITNYQYSVNGGTTWITRSPASTTSPLVISGLQNGTSYDVQIRAVNSEGPGAATSTTQVTPQGPPAAPTITGITQTATSLSVGFTAPSSNGGSTVTNYEYTTDGGTTWVAVSPASTSSPLSISGLAAGTSYSVAIRAVNAIGPGTATATRAVSTYNVPSAPSISSVELRDSSLLLNVSLGSNGGTPLTNLEYSIDNGVTWVARNPASTFSPLLVSGLQNGTTYDVRVRAVNAVGESAASAAVQGTPASVPGIPALSGSVTASSQSISVTISPPNDGGSAITGYEYSTDRGATWRGRTDSGGTSSSLQIDFLSTDGITRLTNGVEYCVQVRALNAVGTGLASSDLCTTPKSAPDAPVVTSAISRDRAIDIEFTLGSNGGEPITSLEYCISTCTSASDWITASSIQSPLRISGLTNGTNYTVTLRSSNTIGTSANSATQNASTVPANSPSEPTVTSVTTSSQSATVTFSAPISDGGSAITNYQYSLDGGTTWTTRSPVSTSSPLVINGLTNGTTYGISLRAVTSYTTGLASSTTFATPLSIPSSPQSVVTTGLNQRISVSFTAPDSGGSPITTYQYALSTDNGTSYGSWVSTNSTLTSFTINGLVNGTGYRVLVRALNAVGDGTSSTAQGANTTPSGVPESPAITSTGNADTLGSLTGSQIAVYFTEPANNGSTISNYQYSTDGGTTWRNRTDGTGRFSPIVISNLSTDGTTALSRGTSYPVTIRAVNANGNGDPSAQTTITTGGDLVPPTVTITTASATSSSRVFTYSLQFSESISGFATSDFVQSSGTASCSTTAVSASTGTNLTATVTCTTDGTVVMRLAANAVTDSGGNTGPVALVTTTQVQVDGTVPQVAYVVSSTSTTRNLSYQVDFTEIVSGMTASDFSQTGGTAACSTTSVSASTGSSFVFTVVCSSDGTVVMTLASGAVTDGINAAPATASSASSVLVDSVIPTVTVTPSGATSASRTLTYSLQFSESISGFALADFVQDSGTASCSTTAISSASGTSLTATVTCSNDGTVVMKLLANSITDVGGNIGPANAVTTSQVRVDATVPQVTYVVPATSSVRSLNYQVDFTEIVSDVTTADFVQTSGTASCATSTVSASTGSSFVFTVVCTTDGTVVMSLLSGAATDGVNVAPTTSQAAPSITVDSIVPTVVVTGPPTPSSSSTLTYTFDFSETISGFSLSDFVQTSGTASCMTTAISAFGGTSITATVTCATEGTVEMSLVANAFTDGINSAPVSAFATGSVKFDQTPPSASVVSTQVNAAQRTVSYLVRFSEPISGLVSTDFEQTGGTASCKINAVTPRSSTEYVVDVACTSDGTVEISLVANSVTDGLFTGPQSAMATGSVSVVANAATPPINRLAPIVVPPPVPTPAPLPSMTTTTVVTPQQPVLIDGSLPEVRTNVPVVLVGGQEIQAVIEVVPDVGIRIVLPTGVELNFIVTDQGGNSLPPSPDGVIQVDRGARIRLAGEGVMPGSEVVVWLFSEPKLLGTVIADADGKFVADFPVGSDVEIGQHTAQINAVGLDGSPLSVNSAVRVDDNGRSTNSSDAWAIFLGIFMAVVAAVVGTWLFIATRRSRRNEETA